MRDEPWLMVCLRRISALLFLAAWTCAHAQEPAPPPTSDLESLRAAADKGDAQAQFRLGVMFASGRGAERDLPQAAYWFQKSAEQGNAAAQFNLAVLYAQGAGVPQDPVIAAKFSDWLPTRTIPLHNIISRYYTLRDAG